MCNIAPPEAIHVSLVAYPQPSLAPGHWLTGPARAHRAGGDGSRSPGGIDQSGRRLTEMLPAVHGRNNDYHRPPEAASVTDRSRVRAASVTDRSRVRAVSVTDRSRVRAVSVTDRSRVRAVSVTDRSRVRAASVTDRSRVRVQGRLRYRQVTGEGRLRYRQVTGEGPSILRYRSNI